MCPINFFLSSFLSIHLHNIWFSFQAVVCHDEINWRKRSRKLVLFSTDSEFHYAGDGKLGGIVEPNDGHCHLDADGYEYEYSTIQVGMKMIIRRRRQCGAGFDVRGRVFQRFSGLSSTLGQPLCVIRILQYHSISFLNPFIGLSVHFSNQPRRE